jgi:hypothetical protein
VDDTTVLVSSPSLDLLLNATSLSSSETGQASSHHVAVAVGETLTFIGVVYVCRRRGRGRCRLKNVWMDWNSLRELAVVRAGSGKVAVRGVAANTR